MAPAALLALGFTAWAAAAVPVHAQSTGDAASATAPSEPTFRIEALGPGVWAAVVTDRPPTYAFANSLVVELDGGLLVVDTQQSPSAARDLLHRLPMLSAKPVRWVFATHDHPDHLLGNVVYRDTHPGVSFLASAGTAAEAATELPGWVEEERGRIPATIRERETWLETGTGPGGQELTAADREAVAYGLRVRKGYLQDLETLEIVLPRAAFEDETSLPDGPGGPVRLIHVGPAHTTGDAVAWLPGPRIAAVGDLVEAGLPWMEGSDPPGWADALERIVALDPASVVPAHGRVEGGLELLRLQARLMRSLVDQVRSGLNAGRTFATILEGVDLRAFQGPLVGEGDQATARFAAWVEDAVRATWTSLRRSDSRGSNAPSVTPVPSTPPAPPSPAPATAHGATGPASPPVG